MKIRDPLFYINHFEENKIPFQLEQTLYTQKIITNDKTLFYTGKTGLNNYELNLIKRVKKVAQISNLDLKISSDHIRFIDRASYNLNKAYTSELYEIDLNSAYWEASLKLGIIDRPTFDYGKQKKISKKARLISLGALAKRTYITSFNGDSYSKLIVKESETAPLFFACAQETIRKIATLKILCENKYLFYWCDAIIFRGNENLEKCENWLKSENIPYKIIPLTKVVVNKDKINVYSNIKGKEYRYFTFQSSKKPYLYNSNNKIG